MYNISPTTRKKKHKSVAQKIGEWKNRPKDVMHNIEPSYKQRVARRRNYFLYRLRIEETFSAMYIDNLYINGIITDTERNIMLTSLANCLAIMRTARKVVINNWSQSGAELGIKAKHTRSKTSKKK